MNSRSRMFLLELADLLERYDASFYYTIDDDGTHVCVGSDADVFVEHFDADTPARLRKAAA